jgi:hypothetical protein
MWPLFNSMLNVPCHSIEKNIVVKKMMRKIRIKYPHLMVNVTMDELSGNVFNFSVTHQTAS